MVFLRVVMYVEVRLPTSRSPHILQKWDQH